MNSLFHVHMSIDIQICLGSICFMSRIHFWDLALTPLCHVHVHFEFCCNNIKLHIGPWAWLQWYITPHQFLSLVAMIYYSTSVLELGCKDILFHISSWAWLQRYIFPHQFLNLVFHTIYFNFDGFISDVPIGLHSVMFTFKLSSVVMIKYNKRDN